MIALCIVLLVCGVSCQNGGFGVIDNGHQSEYPDDIEAVYPDVLGYVMVKDESGNYVKFSDDMLNIVEADNSLDEAGQGGYN